MDRVHGSPYHGPGPWTPIFTSWGCTINYDLMTFDDTLCDGSSFGKPCTCLIAHLPLKLMLNSSFSLSLVIFKHIGWFWKGIIVLHLVFSAGSANISTRVPIYPWSIVNKHRVTGNWFEYFRWWIKIVSISIAVPWFRLTLLGLGFRVLVHQFNFGLPWTSQSQGD